jgi:hypothetical protein
LDSSYVQPFVTRRMSMKLYEITINDIKDKKRWRAVGNEDLELIEEIKQDDFVYHSAVAVTKKGDVYPGILTKSYSDGGEYGDYYVYYQGQWQQLTPKLKSLEIENFYFPDPQQFDFHLSEEEKEENARKFNENIVKINC